MRYPGMAVMKRGDCKRSFYGGAAAPAARSGYAVVPNSISTPVVSAMASAPQNRTRIAPTLTPAPPVRAATPPRSAKSTSEIPENKGIRPASGAMAVTRRGNAAPSAKLAADVNAA